jgi:PTS system nitrogen regulatory IIA component
MQAHIMVSDVKATEDRASVLKNALSPTRVCVLESTTKDAVLRDMIDVITTSPRIRDKADLTRAVFERETLMSTGIGLGLAVPHVRLESVSKLTMAIGVSREGIMDYASLDDKPVHLVFLIAAPAGQHTEYLRLLSAISSRAKVLNGRLLQYDDAESFCRILMDDCAGENPDPVKGC